MGDKPTAPPRVDWRGADMRNVSFAGVSLEGADFRASDVSGSNFTAANLRYADFRGATMHGTIFQNANLYGAKLQGVEAYEADFRGADMRQSNLGGAYLEGARLPLPSPADLAERHDVVQQKQQENDQKASPDDLPRVNGATTQQQRGHRQAQSRSAKP
jgi:uncharacterized protein YjbI with pentapeptide repeats